MQLARMYRASACIALVCFSAVAFGCGPRSRPFTAPPASVSEPRKFSYAHSISLFRVTTGMTVAAVPDTNTNLVQVDMRYSVGAAEDPKGKEGLAHLVEHIMFELRTEGEKGTLTERLRESSLFHNASTTWDVTNYTSTGVANKLGALLTIERDRLAADCSMLSDELLAREREIVRQEIAWRHGDKPTTRDVLRSELLGDSHAYTQPVGGSDASVASIKRVDVCKFMEEHYGPDRAILVVSGNVNAETLPGIVGPLFGPVDKKSTGERRAVSHIAFTGDERTIALDLEDSAAIVAFRYPAWGTAELVHGDLLTDILHEKLQGQVGKGHLESIEMGFVGGLRSRSIFWLLTPDKAENRSKVVDQFFRTRAGLLAKRGRGRKSQETPDQFAHRRQLKRASLVQALEGFSTRASSVADYLQFTKHMLFMLRDMANLTNLMLPDLREYSRGHFLRKQSRIVLVDPLPKSEGATSASHDGLKAAVQELDISTWKSPVLPGEADRPLELEVARIHPRTERYTLENGLRIILAPDFEYPTIDMRMVFPVGDSMDPPDKPGLAHWTASLLNTEMDMEWSAAIWNRVVGARRMGGNLSAWTTDRSTVFRNRGLAMYADGLLWELHWLLESGTAGKQLKLSKKLVRKFQKKSKAKEDSGPDKSATPFVRYRKTLLAAIYGADHPYALDRSLTEIFLNLNANELEQFRDLNYGANGATLIVAGNFDPYLVRRGIVRLFASWPANSNAAARTPIPDAASRSAAMHAIIVDDTLDHPHVTIAFPSTRGLLQDRALRLVTAEMIDQRIASVRERLGASYGVSAKANFNAGPGSVVISGTVNRHKGAKALALMTEELATLRSGKGIGEDFARARRKIMQQVLADTVNASSVATKLVTEATYNLPADYEDLLATEVGQLTLAQAREQLAKDLRKQNTVLLIRGSKDVGAAMFKGIGITDFETK